jgi:hypothetical protein
MLGWITRIFGSKKQKTKDIPVLHVSKISSYEAYKKHANEHKNDYVARLSFERSLIPEVQTEFIFNGFCYVCKAFVDFIMDFQYSWEVDGTLIPNWRERLVCPKCQLNNRMRAIVHIFEQELQPNRNSKIYIAEQTTPLYKWFEKSFPYVHGSEYLGDSTAYGSCNNDGIRNEDLTRLSFDNDEFDYILSFDVFEHIPNYKKALAECC